MGNKGYKIAEIIIKITDQVLSFIIAIILILLLLYAGYGIWDSQQVSNAADSSAYTVYKPEANDTQSFEELTAKNPEVFSWLTINDTPIDYPVAQADDNAKYINTNAEGEYSLSGSLFLDCRNEKDFSDPVSIIYGHDMAEGKMFGSLKKFANADFFETHKNGSLFYNGHNIKLEVAAYFETDAYNTDIYDPKTRPDELTGYTDMAFDLAIQSRDLEITKDDHVIILSTCNTAKTNGRSLLMCVLR